MVGIVRMFGILEAFEMVRILCMSWILWMVRILGKQWIIRIKGY